MKYVALTKNWSNAELKKLCKITAYDSYGTEEADGGGTNPGGGSDTGGGGSNTEGGGSNTEGGGTNQGTGGTDSGTTEGGDSGHVNL